MQADLRTEKPNWRYRCLNCNQDFELPEGSTSCPNDSSPLVPLLDDPLLGSLIEGKYRITELLAFGSTSKIYKARHEYLHIDIVVKVLQQVYRTDKRQVARFQQEAKLASSLIHPNIVKIFDCGVEPDPYIAMEYVDGKTLAVVIKESGALPSTTAFAIFHKICDGMQAAHELGLIHRDLKPSNIMIMQNSYDLRIIDFGIARSLYNDDRYTRTGETLGSPPYMSPEQCRGEELDARSDIYSLGCLMYEVLTDERPFAGKNAVESIFKQIETEAPPLKKICPNQCFPQGTNHFLNRCLAKNPAQRYQSMAELSKDLQLIQAGKGKKIKSVVTAKINPIKRGFLSAAVVLVLISVPVVLFFGQPAVESDNKLALADQAPFDGTLNIPINPLFSLDGMTKQEILSLRKKYIEKHKRLLLNPYRPFDAIFAGIVDKRPWVALQGLYLHEHGAQETTGPSLESMYIANPYFLVGAVSKETYNWNRAIKDNPDKIPNFPYTCMPENLQWTPRFGKMEVTYNLESYWKRVKELLPAEQEIGEKKFRFENYYYNARDLGFTYLSARLESSSGSEDISGGIIRIKQYLHGGNVCGIPCNNAGDNGPFRKFDVKPPCDERILLWLKRPWLNTPPDVTCILHFN